MKKTIFILILILGIGLTAAAQETKIATSIFPISDIVRKVAGEESDVIFVVPIGANPHTYEPTPSTVKALKSVDVFIGVQKELDGWIKDYLPTDASVLFLNENLTAEEHECHHHKKGHNHHHDDEHHCVHDNPHTWLSVKNTKKLASQIAHHLTAIDSSRSDDYESNLKAYQKKLDALHQEIAAKFEGIATKKLIQWHPAWSYFAEDYGLTIVATIQTGHGDEPSVKEFKTLIDTAREENVSVIIIGLNLESKSVSALQREISGELVRLDSVGNPDDEARSTYIQLMRYNAEKLSEALK